mgnify:CR=1 FL=1
MKVIFLDNDGVICLSSNWGSRHKKQKKWGGRKLSMTIREMPVEYRFDNFDKKAIKILNEILETTDAEIVVSSDWRLHANLEELGEYYESQGIIKKPFDEFLKSTSKGEHDFALLGMANVTGQEEILMSLTCQSLKNGSNRARWCNEEYDKLISLFTK